MGHNTHAQQKVGWAASAFVPVWLLLVRFRDMMRLYCYRLST